jgi:hypothetical protein
MSGVYANPYNQSVKINGFGLGVTAGVPIRKINRAGNVYFAMPDLTEYKIVLSNENMTRCDATVYIDDVAVGTWRIGAFSNIMIERPAAINRKFVLVKEGTNIAYQAGIGSYDTNGLISAVFRPERIIRRRPYVPRRPRRYDQPIRTQETTNYTANNADGVSARMQLQSNNLQPAGTGLGDYSDQQFLDADRIFTYDNRRITTINVRLIVDDSLYSQNRITSVRNIPYASNPVPPRVDDYDYYNYNDPYNNQYYYDPNTGQYYVNANY